jgi:hypothetical protein
MINESSERACAGRQHAGFARSMMLLLLRAENGSFVRDLN